MSADMGGMKLLAPTPGATVTLVIDPSVKHVIAAWTAGEAETINCSGSPSNGQLLTIIITNDATLGRLITFGTGFSSSGTALGVISKRSTMSFAAYNGTFWETSRTIGVLV